MLLRADPERARIRLSLYPALFQTGSYAMSNTTFQKSHFQKSHRKARPHDSRITVNPVRPLFSFRCKFRKAFPENWRAAALN